MALQELYKTARIMETLENYARSDHFTEMVPYDGPTRSYGTLPTEQLFWKRILRDPEAFWNTTFTFEYVALSEWVSRVPGLFYGTGSSALRKIAESKIEFTSSGKWVHYSPIGKSEKVMGGIGSICLSIEDGYHLCSISQNGNASVGIPVLISQSIWEELELQEGRFISKIKGVWRKMNQAWSSRFPSVSNIPKAYLVIEKAEDIRFDEYMKEAPTLFHPFSIMEYEKEGGVFYDYVYATVDSSEDSYREKLRDFFGEYEYNYNRNGRYLIEPFVHNPLLNNVLYTSPQDLRSRAPQASSHLDLLIKRIRKDNFKGQTIDSVKIALDNEFSLDQLKRLSDMIQVNPNRWFSGRSLVDESAALLDYCYEREKLEELIDAMSVVHPRLFIQA